MTAEFMSAFVDASYAKKRGASYTRAIRYLETIHAFVDRHPDKLRFATTAADVRLAKERLSWQADIALEHGLKQTIEYFDRLLRGGTDPKAPAAST